MLKYEDFRAAIDSIRRHSEMENKINAILKDEDFMRFSFGSFEADMLELLTAAMDDEGEWISHWIYELDMGEKYHDGCVSYEDGSFINIKTEKDLYDFVCLCHSERRAKNE